MARTDAKKQEFIAAIQTVAAIFAEHWWDGGGKTPNLVLSPPSPEDNEQMLGRGDVAKMLDVSTRTVDRLVKEKQLTPVRLTGRNPKFRKSEVERFIRRRE